HVRGALQHALVDRCRLELRPALERAAAREAPRRRQRARAEALERGEDRGRAPDEDARVPEEAAAGEELLGARAVGLLDEALNGMPRRRARRRAPRVSPTTR